MTTCTIIVTYTTIKPVESISPETSFDNMLLKTSQYSPVFNLLAFASSCYSFALPWNLFTNMHTTITLYVARLRIFQIHISPPLDKFSTYKHLNQSVVISYLLRL